MRRQTRLVRHTLSVAMLTALSIGSSACNKEESKDTKSTTTAAPESGASTQSIVATIQQKRKTGATATVPLPDRYQDMTPEALEAHIAANFRPNAATAGTPPLDRDCADGSRTFPTDASHCFPTITPDEGAFLVPFKQFTTNGMIVAVMTIPAPAQGGKDDLQGLLAGRRIYWVVQNATAAGSLPMSHYFYLERNAAGHLVKHPVTGRLPRRLNVCAAPQGVHLAMRNNHDAAFADCPGPGTMESLKARRDSFHNKLLPAAMYQTEPPWFNCDGQCCSAV